VHAPPFCWGDSNSGKSTVFEGIKQFLPAFGCSSSDNFPYNDSTDKAVMIWDDFSIPTGSPYYDLLKCLEGEPGHTYNTKRSSYKPVHPIKFFLTCEKLPVKKMRAPVDDAEFGKSAAPINWVTGDAKTMHFHNRLEIFGPFIPFPSDGLKDLRGAGRVCPKQYYRWLLDHKDRPRLAVTEYEVMT
jgi:hypothetical protein